MHHLDHLHEKLKLANHRSDSWLTSTLQLPAKRTRARSDLISFNDENLFYILKVGLTLPTLSSRKWPRLL